MSNRTVKQVQHIQKLIQDGELDQAARLCATLTSSIEPHPHLQHLSGVIALRKGEFRAALEIYHELLQKEPNKTEYLYNHGVAALRAGEPQSAVNSLARVVQLLPEQAHVWADLCLAHYYERSNPEAAVNAGRQAVRLQPESAAAHYNLALALQAWRDLEASLTHFLEADRLSPGHVDIDFDLGNVYIGLGMPEKARERFRSVLAHRPRHVSAYFSLARITRYESVDHPDAVQLRQFLMEDWMSAEQRASAYFALGKICQDCKLYDQAFEHYLEGNRIRDEELGYDPEKFAAFTSALKQHYTKESIAEKSAFGSPSNIPIFIVGTPRSGTTLTEQIIASHPDVFGAGELEWFAKCVNALPTFTGDTHGYPQCVDQLSRDNCRALSGKYLDYITQLADGQARITDKLPDNFQHLGLIHILFPHARIIHCKRNPLDACVSMFTNNFAGGMEYIYDLFKLGRYYREYQLLMEHWKAVLPEHVIMEVEYEDMVADQEAVSRRILDFLGLDWHADCLKFFEHKRHVMTASDTQVRQPIYRSSVGRWQHYEKYLGPLREGLRD